MPHHTCPPFWASTASFEASQSRAALTGGAFALVPAGDFYQSPFTVWRAAGRSLPARGQGVALSLVLVSSIAIRVVAMVWSVVLWRAVRDWRMGFLTLMLVLMATRQLLTLVRRQGGLEASLTQGFPVELPGLVVSVMAFLAVVSLERILRAQRRAERERVRLAEQLRHQQKLKSIGTLASGVAHEINNPVQGIMSYAELIKRRATDLPEVCGHAAEIINESHRVANIVRSLLVFAQQEKQIYRAESVGDIVEGVLSLMLTLLHQDQIELTVEMDSDLPAVRCQKQQIQQVLMNLVTNARDALNARYAEAHPDKRIAIRARTTRNGAHEFVRLTVEDRGIGIPPEAAERLFDPFFTTKDDALGTGLGLSVSHGIVHEHGGRLTFESQPGLPTRFHVDLPISAKSAA